MTEYELCVLSRLGESYHYKYEGESAHEAISWTYWGIGGCHWFLCSPLERPCVRIRWKSRSKRGDVRTYTKTYTCQRLRLLDTVGRYTQEDLTNILIGKDLVFIVTDNATGKDESYHESMSTIDKHQLIRDKSVRYEWIHKSGEDRDLKEFMEQFEGVKDAVEQ